MVAGEWIAPMNNEENTANIAQGASRISTPTDTTHPLRKRNSWAILRGASSTHIWTAARIAFDTVSPPFAITMPSRHKHTPLSLALLMIPKFRARVCRVDHSVTLECNSY